MSRDVYSSHITGKQFRVKVRASCKFSRVMYLIQFRKRSQQYVIEIWQSLQCRINSHCYDIKHRRIQVSPKAHTLAGRFDHYGHRSGAQPPSLPAYYRESMWIMTLRPHPFQEWTSWSIVYEACVIGITISPIVVWFSSVPHSSTETHCWNNTMICDSQTYFPNTCNLSYFMICYMLI